MLDDISVAVIAFIFVASAFLCAFCFDVFRVRRHRQTSQVQTGQGTTARGGAPSRVSE
jgi:hypothetical protein